MLKSKNKSDVVACEICESNVVDIFENIFEFKYYYKCQFIKFIINNNPLPQFLFIR